MRVRVRPGGASVARRPVWRPLALALALALVACARAQDRAQVNARVPEWSSRVACWNVRARVLPSNLTVSSAGVREVVTGALLPAQQASGGPPPPAAVDRLLLVPMGTVDMARVMAVWSTPARRTAFVRFGATAPATGGAVLFVGGSDAFSVILENGSVIARLSLWEVAVAVQGTTQARKGAALPLNPQGVAPP
jgi:hypothetical protein